jgi:hypothetical protein
MRLFIIFLIIGMAAIVNAKSLTWDASTGDVTGYTAYWGTSSGEFPYNYDAGDLLIVNDIGNTFNLHPGVKYFFVVKAYNSKGESDASNEVEYTVPEYTPPDNNLPIRVERPATITIIVE